MNDTTQEHALILAAVLDHPGEFNLNEPSPVFGWHSLTTITQLIELGALKNDEGRLSYVKGLWQCLINHHKSFSMVEIDQCPECGYPVNQLEANECT